MIELALAILSGILRRVDGMKKTHWKKWEMFDGGLLLKLSDVSAFFTRLLPILISVALVVPHCFAWWHYVLACGFGVGITLSLQRGYGGWTEFSIRQIFQHQRGMAAFLLLAAINPLLTLYGIIGCLMAGLSHPVLARTGMKRYTELAEFLTGVFILLAFAIV